MEPTTYPFDSEGRLIRPGRLVWIRLGDLVVDPQAQRGKTPGINRIAAAFDPRLFGIPLVSIRDGKKYIVDGQQRCSAMIKLGWSDRFVQCWAFDHLELKDEADVFLGTDDRTEIKALPKFHIARVAGRPAEIDIDRIVQANGYTVSTSERGISAVASLRRTYDLAPGVLNAALLVIDQAYGPTGMRGEVLEGAGMVLARYTLLEPADVAVKLNATRGGIGALSSKAHYEHKHSGMTWAHCYASAIVDLLNAGRGGKKLHPWRAS